MTRARLDGGWDVAVQPVPGGYWWNCWQDVTSTELSGLADSEQEAWFAAGGAMVRGGHLGTSEGIRLAVQ